MATGWRRRRPLVVAAAHHDDLVVLGRFGAGVEGAELVEHGEGYGDSVDWFSSTIVDGLGSVR